MGVPRLASRARTSARRCRFSLAPWTTTCCCACYSRSCASASTLARLRRSASSACAAWMTRARALTCRRFLALLCSDTASALAKELRARVHTRVVPRALRDPGCAYPSTHTPLGEHRLIQPCVRSSGRFVERAHMRSLRLRAGGEGFDATAAPFPLCAQAHGASLRRRLLRQGALQSALA